MIAEGAVGARRTTVPLLLCTGTATHFTSLNAEWERLLGWTSGELLSRPVADFVHPNDRDRTLAEAAKVGLPGYEVVNFENRFRARGGQWRWLRWSARADGFGWVAAAVDITEERQADPWLSAWAPSPSPMPDQTATGVGPATPPRAPRRVSRAVVARAAFVAIGVLAVLVLQAIGNEGGDLALRTSGAPVTPAVREVPRHMFGPLNGAGAMYTLGRTALHPPAMLGPAHGVVRPTRGR